MKKIKKSISRAIVKEKVDRCISLLNNGQGVLVKEYTHTVNFAGKEIDYFTKYIKQEGYTNIRLTIDQYNRLKPLAEKLGAYVEDLSNKPRPRYQNRTIK